MPNKYGYKRAFKGWPVRILLLLVMLNVGVIQSLSAMDYAPNPYPAPEAPMDPHSLYDLCDLAEEMLLLPCQQDTLYIFLQDYEEDDFRANWHELQPLFEPLLEQSWKNCNNGWIEAPMVYAAKKGLASFIAYVLDKTDLIIDQKILDQALHGAVLYDRDGIIRMLLAHGANPNGYIMQRGFISRSTLEVAVIDIDGTQVDTKPNLEILKSIIATGARPGPHGLHPLAQCRLAQVIKEHPEIKKIYTLMQLFGATDLSLKQHSILQIASGSAEIDSLPDDLKHPIEEARILLKSDALLNLDHHH